MGTNKKTALPKHRVQQYGFLIDSSSYRRSGPACQGKNSASAPDTATPSGATKKALHLDKQYNR
jgi:hypothetical protein